MYSLKLLDMPLKLTISCDGSNAIISSAKKLNLLYFRKLFNREKQKKLLKQENCEIYKNVIIKIKFNKIGPIEMHPFFDEKEYFAGAYENNIFVLKVSKNSININEAKKFPNGHYENIRFLAWQCKQHGFLASTSSDKVINLYDTKFLQNRNPIIKIIDDDIIKSIKFAYVNNTYLATGYDKRLKIWDINKTTIKPIIEKKIFDGAVDILDWHNTQNNILCGCKQENLIKIFGVSKDNFKLIYQIKVGEKSEDVYVQKLLTAYFIPGNGVIAVCEKKAFIYHLGGGNGEFLLDQIYPFASCVTNFKIMTNNLNNHYFVYTDKDTNLIVRQYAFDEYNSNQKRFMLNNILTQDRNANLKKYLFLKEIENIKQKYPTNLIVENKTDKYVYNFKLSQDLIMIKLKITFDENFPKTLPIVDFENKNESFLIDKTLISNVNKEINKWQENEKWKKYDTTFGVLECLITSLIKIIADASIQIEEIAHDNAKILFKKTGKISTEITTILPYVRTCSFTWGPKGSLVTFHYNRIDFKQLNQADKMITNFNNLDDWIKFCEANDERKKFSRRENKLIEDEKDLIITDKLKNIVDWKSMFDYEDNVILNSINRIDSLPHLFINTNIFDFRQEHFPDKNRLDKEENDNNLYISHANSSAQGMSNICDTNMIDTYMSPEFGLCGDIYKKKFLISIHQMKESCHNQILKNLNIKLISRNHFYASIKNLLDSKKNHTEIVFLSDILNTINYNINSITEPANISELLMKYYRNSIMAVIRTLEKHKNYEFMYISILLITSRICDDIIQKIVTIPSLVNNFQTASNTFQRDNKRNPTIIYFNKEDKRNLIGSRLSVHSEYAPPTKSIIERPKRKSNYPNFYPSSSNYKLKVSRSSSFDIQEDESKLYNEDPSEFFASVNENLEYEKEDDEKSNLTHCDYENLCVKNEKKRNEQDLLKIFGDKIIEKFVDFLYFYSNELYRMNRMIERAELIKFIYLISTKINIDKYNNVIENSYVNVCPKKERMKRIYSNFSISSTNQPRPEVNCMYEKLQLFEEKRKKKYFKTKLFSEEKATCDICGERLKIGTMSFYSPYYNLKGHPEHLLEYINSNYNSNYISNKNK